MAEIRRSRLARGTPQLRVFLGEVRAGADVLSAAVVADMAAEEGGAARPARDGWRIPAHRSDAAVMEHFGGRDPVSDLAGKWCILQTSSGRTLPLVRALVAVGFDAWTPTKMETRRRPRSKIEADREVAMAPTYAFVSADRLDDLWRAMANPLSPLPPFSIFTLGRRVGLVSTSAIAELREEEERAGKHWQAYVDKRERRQRRSQRYFYGRGTVVRVADESNFTGLVGIVESGDDKSAMISFAGRPAWKIETWRLVPDGVSAAASNRDAAARAA